MSIDALILIVCSTAIILLGTLIFVRNPAQSNNRRFAFLSISLLAWTLFNFLSDQASSNNLLFTRLTFVGGLAAIYFVLNFISNFPNDRLFHKHILMRIHAVYALSLLPIVFLPQFISSVSDKSEGASINTSYLYFTFVGYVIYSMVLLVLIIRKQIVNAKTFLQKQQILIISWGIALYGVLAVGSNVLIPSLVNNWSSSRFGPAFTLLFVGMVAYTIVKHRLFDIRLVIARSLAYIFLLATLATIFAVTLLGLTSVFFDDTDISTGTEFSYVLLAIATAFLVQPLKKFFDKVTNNLFYRDAYDSQDLLNNLNKSLVTTIDLEQLLNKSSRIIGGTLKTEFCSFAIQDIKNQPLRFIGGAKNHFNEVAVTMVATAAKQIRDKIIILDELGSEKHELKELMQAANLSVIVKLQERTEVHSQHASYILLGQKKSGSLYSSQDSKILGIIADELVIAIQNSLRFEEIQQFNVTLQQKVEEATKQLRNANQRLKELDQTKDEFISMASHQLRTPLTTIKGYLSMVLEGDVGPVTKSEKKMIQQAFDSAERMVFLIADLLNVSRLQSGKFVIDNKPTDLAKMVKTEVEQLKDTAAHHNLTLTCKVPDKMPLLSLDETKIRQVVMNFLDNAIYYTPAGGSISVELELTPDSINYTVTDTGLGVPKAEQHHLFSKFYRAGNARKMRPDGTGLGLFMARKVIVAQGGSVIFKSTEGKGSTFGFSFPRHKLEIKGKHTEKPAAEPAAA